MRRSPEYRQIDSLEPEQQAKVELLETKSQEIPALRSALGRFYREYKSALPVDPADPRGRRRLRLTDLAQLRVGGARIEDLIPADPEVTDVASKWRRVQTIGAIERAIHIQTELKNQGGAWEEDTEQGDAERDLRDYYKMQWGERSAAAEALAQKRAHLDELEAMIELAHSHSDFTPHPSDIMELETAYATALVDIENFTMQSPEAYLLTKEQELGEAKRLFDEHGRIVETPFVKAKIARVVDIIESGRPAFVHGELGAGKTEFAKHLARTRLSRAHLARWEQVNPMPTAPADLAVWNAQRAQQAEALVISGHRQLEPEQMLGTRTIKRADTIAPEEQTQRIRDGWKHYRARVLEEASLRGDRDTKRLEKKLDTVDRPLYEQAYLDTFRSPVEVRTVLGAVLQAMREGRPVIIDEMNAIPHHVLIVLNDLLMRHPGEMVTPTIPGEDPFVVQEGFSVIATGNYKPEDGLMYIGRQPLDAAFLSRFGVVNYDYLPMEKATEAPGLPPEEQRAFRANNELYHMLMTRLADRDLSATLPEGGFRSIYNLAKVAREIQDVFSGRESTLFAEVNAARVKPQEVLKENVLSIRHLIPIVERWKLEGYTLPLDDYIYLEYIARSDARPNEKWFLYRTLKVQGDFFPDSAGWPTVGEREKALRYDIDDKMYGVDLATGRRKSRAAGKQTLRQYSKKQVIEELYGPAPKRTRVPKRYIERPKAAAKPSEEAETEDTLERARLLDEMKASMDIVREAGFLVDPNSEQKKKSN